MHIKHTEVYNKTHIFTWPSPTCHIQLFWLFNLYIYGLGLKLGKMYFGRFKNWPVCVTEKKMKKFLTSLKDFNQSGFVNSWHQLGEPWVGLQDLDHIFSQNDLKQNSSLKGHSHLRIRPHCRWSKTHTGTSLGDMTLSIMTFRITTLSIMTFRITTLSIMTFSTMTFNKTIY